MTDNAYIFLIYALFLIASICWTALIFWHLGRRYERDYIVAVEYKLRDMKTVWDAEVFDKEESITKPYRASFVVQKGKNNV